MRRAAARPRPRARLVALLALAALLVGGCSFAPGASTNPDCPNGDVRAAGSIPKLEALLPRGMIERSPDTLDSGTNCTRAALGTYAARGITKLQFAGATWNQGDGNGTVVAILAVDGAALDSMFVEEFYTAGAVAARRTGEVVTDRPTMRGPGVVFRLETINDLSLQTVVIWPAAPYVHVVIVATKVSPDASRADHDARLEMAVEVAAGIPVS